MKLRFLILLVLPVALHAQEPSTKIQPADTITRIAILPQTTTVATGNAAPDMPIIYPDPLPAMKLGQIARDLRAAHAAAPKATKVANDETPIQPKEEEKQ